MSLVRKVFSDSAFTAVRSLLQIARGLVVIPIITNLLGADSYGIWVTVLAIVTLVSSAGGLHLHGALIRYGSQDLSSNQTYSDVLFLSFVLGFAITVSGIGLSMIVDVSQWLSGDLTNQVTLVTIVGALLYLRILLNVNMNFPRSKGVSKFYDVIRLLRSALETVALVGVFVLGGGILAGLGALVAVAAILNIGVFGFVVSSYSVPLPDPSNFGVYVRFGAPMIPKEVSTYLLADIDKYLLLFFMGAGTVGIYSVAEKICKPIVTLTKVFNPSLYPRITEAWEAENFSAVTNVYESIFRYYSILGIPAMFGLVVLSEPLMTVLSNAEIAEQGFALVPIFIVGYFLKGYDNPIRYILTSAERTELIGGAVTAAVVFNIVANILLIPNFEMVGAAVATLGAQTLLFGLIFYFSQQRINLRLPWNTIGRSFVASVAMAVVLWYIDMGLTPPQQLVAYPFVGAGLYFALIYVLGEFTSSELENMKKELPLQS